MNRRISSNTSSCTHHARELPGRLLSLRARPFRDVAHDIEHAFIIGRLGRRRWVLGVQRADLGADAVHQRRVLGHLEQVRVGRRVKHAAHALRQTRRVLAEMQPVRSIWGKARDVYPHHED